MKELKTDEDLATVLDDLKYHIKPLVAGGSLFARLFNFWLNGFILRYGLDKDQHAFVVIPEGGIQIPKNSVPNAFACMVNVIEQELLHGVSSKLHHGLGQPGQALKILEEKR